MKLVKLVGGSLLALTLSLSLFSACKKDAPSGPSGPAAVTSVSLNVSELVLLFDQTYQFTATVYPDNAVDKTVTWSSSNEHVVSMVDDNGLVRATQLGEAEIEVKTVDGEKTAVCKVVVVSSMLVDLSENGTANCYIVSSACDYSFNAVQGNSSTSVGNIASVEVLWESFGTGDAPNVGDIVRDVRFANGKIFFSTPSSLKDGNALIAAKDADGTILWSWHIWVCGSYDPVLKAHTYKNNAGVMMDRNLGATTAQAGADGSWGLLYQWGRKDPFMGTCSKTVNLQAASTLSSWNNVYSDEKNGTIEYAVQHPTTYIAVFSISGSNYDWYYTGDETTDNQRWKSDKTIYDPCPYGWRVPDGGPQGIWATASGKNATFYHEYDSEKCAMNLGTDFIGSGNAWYCGTGYLINATNFSQVKYGLYWSCTPGSGYEAYYMSVAPVSSPGECGPVKSSSRVNGFAVRCQKDE